MQYEYIGYGLTRNESPSEQHVYECADAAMQYLLQDKGLQQSDIYLYVQISSHFFFNLYKHFLFEPNMTLFLAMVLHLEVVRQCGLVHGIEMCEV